MDKIKIHAPATVANLSCGFDVLGLCLNEPYDEIEVHKISQKVVSLEILESPYSNIPDNPSYNTGGVPAQLIQKDFNLDFSKCFLLGDRAKDIEAGNACNCTTILVNAMDGELEKCSPDFHVEDIVKAAEIILRGNKND